MTTFKGKGVYGAIAVGKASVFKHREETVERIRIDDTVSERKRLARAKEIALTQLELIYQNALKEIGRSNASIFEIHKLLLEDRDYNGSIVGIIETQKVNAEYAVSVTSDNFAGMFNEMDDAYMKARAADVRDISNRLIAALFGMNLCTAGSNEPVIVCSDDLLPSETIVLDKDNTLGFITAAGSQNSHTAILARNMNIPAVIGVGELFLEMLHDGDTVAIDGFAGEVYINPDDITLARLNKKLKTEQEKKRLLAELKGKENITLDGTKVEICANIGGVEDLGAVLLNDAGGIGLFRSEFLYLRGNCYPGEEEQFAAYKRVLESMTGKRVVIRTMDIGADKKAEYMRLKDEENPAMGVRGVRLCLSRPDIFRTQLRALYRASVYGRLGIMFPMITSTSEVWRILAMCDEVKDELTVQGCAFSEDIELGIMIETPAAALISDKLAPFVDFFSVGTNDLTQFTLACDRHNPDAEEFMDAHHEAVLRLIEMSAENAHENGAWIGICGELAADLSLTETFLRMGIDEFSVAPSAVLKLREKVRSLDLSEEERIAM